MTTPKRGMVAGQPIKTGDLSKEYENEFQRIFGDRKPARGKFVYVPGEGMVEVGADWTDTERRAQTATEALTYDGLKATDGTDISSKRKRREWMKEKGLADADDFKGVWAKAETERAKFYTGQHDKRELKETVGRARYEAQTQRRRRR